MATISILSNCLPSIQFSFDGQIGEKYENQRAKRFNCKQQPYSLIKYIQEINSLQNLDNRPNSNLINTIQSLFPNWTQI